jgi:hypothetical protein
VISDTAELEITPLRPDGTPHKPMTIWVVRHGDDLYVRSYRGTDGSWFRHAQSARQGLIWAGGIGKDVTFADETDPALKHQIDDAYRDKYEPPSCQLSAADACRMAPRYQE